MFTNQNKYQKHNFFMHLALNQARKMIGNTRENPSVGCVVVKGNKLIRAGCTSINGRPHAEQNALSLSPAILKNSNLYVTLEPCTHYGKTPPCVKLIIKKKIKKVFFSINDPDKRTYNKASAQLKKKGIIVNKGILQNKLNFFYRSYYRFKKRELPFVSCKLAISKDYFSINKTTKWLTNKYSRGRVHLMRSSHDCLLTSSSTVNHDNPDFTCRISGLEKYTPARIILDNKLKIKINSKLVHKANIYRTIIFYNKHNDTKARLLKKFGVKLIKISLDDNNNLNLKHCLKKVKNLGFSRIFLESGIKLIASFLNENLIDDFILFKSDQKIKKKGTASFKKYFNSFLSKRRKKIEKVYLFGDKLILYKMK